MSETKTAVVDWRDFEEPQQAHVCDCEHCDLVGEPLGQRFRLLYVIRMGAVEYVTDKYLALRSDLAPVADDYEGGCLADPSVMDPWPIHPLGGAPDPDTLFLWHIAKTCRDRGWQLRKTAGTELRDTYRWAIQTGAGEHIGWAMSGMQSQPDPDLPGHNWSYRLIAEAAR